MPYDPTKVNAARTLERADRARGKRVDAFSLCGRSHGQ